MVTGARQVGKATLARSRYPELRYLNLDAIEEREALAQVRTSAWGRTVGSAMLDEVQKAPGLVDKVKYAYDEGVLEFSVLLGSSRFQLLDGVRESLAGRAFVYDLWPLMPSELLNAEQAEPDEPLLDRLLAPGASPSDVLVQEPEVLLGDDETRRREAVEHLAQWGGMPELLRLEDDERREWLRSYQRTFLERDLSDLARLRDLLPFRTLQRLAMLRTGRLLSWSDLGRDAGIDRGTARRYVEYLRMSYQVFLLPPLSPQPHQPGGQGA